MLFLDAFYNRSDFGYDVKRWKYTDINQTIIDIVEQMGNDISLNTKVLQVANILKTVAEGLIGGVPTFIVALFKATIDGSITDAIDIISTTKDELVKEKAKLRANGLAWAVVTQVMAREKGNIELAFLGFI